jgi:O-6-methylguanine DNA methyltransferase
MYSTTLDFPFGSIFLAKTNKGLSDAHYLKSRADVDHMMGNFERMAIPLEMNESKFKDEKQLFQRYFAGKREDFRSLRLDFRTGTPFQKSVWREARKIPYGKTESYKSLAEKISTRGYRSVGHALGHNPLLIIIPCHRVIGSDGSLVGFGAGLNIKRFLLDLEQGKTASSD